MSRVEVSNPQSEVLKAVQVFLEKRKSDPKLELTELSEFMLHFRELKTPQNELLKIICDAAIDLSSRQKTNEDLSRGLLESLAEMKGDFKEKGWDEQSGRVHETIAAVIMNCNPPPKDGVVEVPNPLARAPKTGRAPSTKLLKKPITPPQKHSGCCVIS